jgi:hypothetical protein
MTIQNRLLSPSELVKLANKAETLAHHAGQERKEYRIAGRLARDPADARALCDATVEGVKSGNALSLEIIKEPSGWFLLQLAMVQASYGMWEELWNEAHPDRFGRAWEEKDFDLMAVWRVNVRTMIRECRQDAVLAMTAEEWFAKLSQVGVSEESAEALMEWISEIQVGDTRST